MTIARHYIMHAKTGYEATLETALTDLADIVRGLPGCEGVETLRDLGNELRFVFIEKWTDVDAHKAAGSSLPKDVMATLTGALDGPPDGTYLDYLKIV